MKKNLKKSIYFILFAFFLLYLMYLINLQNPSENYTAIIITVIFLDYVCLLFFFSFNLQYNYHNIKILKLKKITTIKLVNKFMYAVFFYLWFIPGGFRDFLIYYLLITIFFCFLLVMDLLEI